MIDAQSTADSLIAFETALEPLYRAKHHKPNPEALAHVKAARDAEEGRKLAERIRNHTADNIAYILGSEK